LEGTGPTGPMGGCAYADKLTERPSFNCLLTGFWPCDSDAYVLKVVEYPGLLGRFDDVIRDVVVDDGAEKTLCALLTVHVTQMTRHLHTNTFHIIALHALPLISILPVTVCIGLLHQLHGKAVMADTFWVYSQ